MPSVEGEELSVVINRPVEEVFAFLAAPENVPRWQLGILENEQTSEGPIGVGTTYQMVSQFLGRRIESTFEVTEYEPNRTVSLKTTSGPGQLEASWTFEAIEGGTKVAVVGKGESSGFFKVAEPIVARMFKRQTEANLGTLKDLLEAQAEGSV
ncbi:MAG: SRPBCC family protein [Candidatus Bipolaricaulia bacterium]